MLGHYQTEGMEKPKMEVVTDEAFALLLGSFSIHLVRVSTEITT